MENSFDERFPRCNPLDSTVEELRKNIRVKLLKPIRFLRTIDSEYIDNLEEDNLANAYFADDIEKNFVFLYAAFVVDDDPELLETLYLRGADVNFSYPGDNINALHLSALQGSSKCARWLLEKGCRIVDSSNHLSPLHFAALSGSQSMCHLLVENGCEVDAKALHIAAWVNAVDCVEYFLELKAPVNEYDEYGNTTLHIASYLNHLKIVQALLRDIRIDVNAKTKLNENTALHLAAENGFVDCSRILLEGGADVDSLTAKKQTPLFLACRETFLDCVELLIKYGATVNVQDDEKRTPLHAAVSRNLNSKQIIHVVRHLIDRQADVHLADRFGYTALHLAALNELDACVEQLILSGANVAAKTMGNVTALNIINRKTPGSTSKIEERLDLCLAYNQEQLLKFSFRDINHNSTVGEVSYLYTLQKAGQAKILEHPICEAFLHLKWQKIRIFVLLRLAISLVTVVLLSLLVSWGIVAPTCYKEVLTPVLGEPTSNPLLQPPVTNGSLQEQCWNMILNSEDELSYNIENCSQKVCKSIILSTSRAGGPNVSTWRITLSCRKKNSLSTKKSENTTDCGADANIVQKFFVTYKSVTGFLWIFIIFMLIMNGIRMVFTLAAYKSKTHFLLQYNNIVEIVVMMSVPLTLIDIHHSNILVETTVGNFEKLQKALASLTLLASWAYLMITVSQLPSIGAYVAMFRKVLKEFLKMILAFLCLLMGFTFTFYTLRTDHFQNPIFGFIKIMAMMTGELNAGDLLDNQNVSAELYSTAIVLSVFMIIITVVLMNLLVGIAVNDVEGLRKNADLKKLIQQTKLIYFLEKTCFKGFFPPYTMKILKRFLYVWPDSYTGVVMYVRPVSPDEKRLPRHVMNAGLKIAISRLKKKKLKEAGKKPTVEDRLHSLEEQIVQLKKLVCAVHVTLEDVARNARVLSSDSNSFCDRENN